MPIKLTAVEDAFYAVLRTDSTGAAVRTALVGDGASAVIWAADLKIALPRSPFVALAIGPVVGKRQDVRQHVLTWFVYDDAPRRWSRIDAIIPLIETAYPADAITFGDTNIVSISQPFTDAALGSRPARSIQFVYTTRR
jgi:hypothetical protein